jgi:hypothetical protein
VLGLLVAAIAWTRRELVRAARWELLLAAIALLFATLPSVAPMRWSFRWLPLVHLGLGLAAARAADLLAASSRDTATRAARNPGVWGAALTLVVYFLAAANGFDLASKRVTLLVVWTALWAVLALAWTRSSRTLGTWAAALLVPLFQVTAFQVVDHRDAPVWRVHDDVLFAAPFDPARTYLVLQTKDDWWDAQHATRDGLDASLRPANIPMLAGLGFVNGYSPLKLRAIDDAFPMGLHGYVEPYVYRDVLEERARPGAMLDRLGIDGLVVGRGVGRASGLDVAATLESEGWVRRATLDAGDVFERPEPARPPAFSPGGAALSNVTTSATRFGADVRNPDAEHDALVVVRRAAYPGYEATLDGSPLRIEPLEGILVAVRVPPAARGRLEVRYRPHGLARGAFAAGVAAILLALLAWRTRSR